MDRRLTHPGTGAWLAGLIAAAASVGCIDGGPAPKALREPVDRARIFAGAAAEPAIDSGLRAELGIVDALDSHAFAPLEEGAPIPFEGVGQAGMTARLAVKITSDGSAPIPDDVFLDVMLEAVDTGDRAIHSAGIPLRLTCRDDGACYRVPLLVEVAHLGPDGVVVEGQLLVRDPDDPERVLATAECYGPLERR